jgi:two-component system, chemotaxis family, chemotaxis protein CheY
MIVDRASAILIVDDFATISRVIRALLERNGFTNIEDVRDGSSALQRLKSKRFALVISDWHLEQMSGLDLLQEMRRDPDLKKVRFILVTADGSFEGPSMHRLGVDGVLMKPFSAERLATCIEQAFAQQK